MKHGEDSMAKNPSHSNTFAPFATTAWTLIRAAQQTSGAERGEAIGLLFRQYWRPVYAFFRAHRIAAADAEGYAQDFLTRFLVQKGLHKAGAGKGRFRSFLSVCAKHYLIDQKRKGKRRPVVREADMLRGSQQALDAPNYCGTPEEAFDDAWRKDLLSRALDTVADEARLRDRLTDYEVFCDYYLCDESERPTWQQVADRRRLGRWKHAARMADWVKGRLARAIRNEISSYTEDDEELEAELLALMS